MWDVKTTATTHELTLVACKVMNAGMYLYMMRLLLCIFGIAAFGYTYAKPGYWTDFEYAAIANLTVIPSATFWYALQWRQYPLNRQGSSMTLRRTPYDPEYVFDQGIPQLINMNVILEPLGILLWTATFVCMILWPTGKDFRLAFEKPPIAVYRSATAVAGLQILLCIAQCWLVIRERQFIKIHIARCHEPVQVDHGLGADNLEQIEMRPLPQGSDDSSPPMGIIVSVHPNDNFEQAEMRPLPQRSVYPSASMATMISVQGSDIHPASFV
ncbi:hypothetical protein MMC27_008280 [Xylographa pallens]|nr:hypothetical protein [Xylographa pallens]